MASFNWSVLYQMFHCVYTYYIHTHSTLSRVCLLCPLLFSHLNNSLCDFNVSLAIVVLKPTDVL